MVPCVSSLFLSHNIQSELKLLTVGQSAARSGWFSGWFSVGFISVGSSRMWDLSSGVNGVQGPISTSADCAEQPNSNPTVDGLPKMASSGVWLSINETSSWRSNRLFVWRVNTISDSSSEGGYSGTSTAVSWNNHEQNTSISTGFSLEFDINLGLVLVGLVVLSVFK